MSWRVPIILNIPKPSAVGPRAATADKYYDAANDTWDHLQMACRGMAITVEAYIF